MFFNISIKNSYYEEDEEDNKINEEIYSGEAFNINIKQENMNFNNSDKNDNIIYPYLNNLFYNKINNNRNDFNLSKLLEKHKSNISLIKLDNSSKTSKECNSFCSSKSKSIGFSNLFTTSSTSFTINAIYENLNKLTGYKIKNDMFLRNKIRNYIIDECFFQTNSIISKQILLKIKRKSQIEDSAQ